jgi:hypothetical protein
MMVSFRVSVKQLSLAGCACETGPTLLLLEKPFSLRFSGSQGEPAVSFLAQWSRVTHCFPHASFWASGLIASMLPPRLLQKLAMVKSSFAFKSPRSH